MQWIASRSRSGSCAAASRLPMEWLAMRERTSDGRTTLFRDVNVIDVEAGRCAGRRDVLVVGDTIRAAAAEVVTLADVERELARIHRVRPDFIKIVYDDVFGTLPNLTPEILGALIDRAHALGYRAAVHVATLSDAEVAVERGADIL